MTSTSALASITNSGAVGSFCAPMYVPEDPYTLSTTGAMEVGLPPAPAYYLRGFPIGRKRPIGIMITIHGGGWFSVGPGDVQAEQPYADFWRSHGWETFNITYRGCAQSLTDVLWFYDTIRSLVGPTMPIALAGQSAGGQLALMIAALRPDVKFVVAEGAPTDLTTIGEQTAFDPSTLGSQTSGPQMVENWAVAAFGSNELSNNSPVNYHIRARVLLASAAADVFIPWAQATELQQTEPHVTLDKLSWGTTPFTHAPVTVSSYNAFMSLSLRLADRAARTTNCNLTEPAL